MSNWTPINEHPGDQKYDGLRGIGDTSYWGEIGYDERKGRWEWTIVAMDDKAFQWEEDGGVALTEDYAKYLVENWSPNDE